MSIFNRTPAWAKQLSKEQYNLFKKQLSDLSAGVYDADAIDRSGLWHGPAGQWINFTNLASVCSRLSIEDWDAEIKRWVEVLNDGNDRPTPSYPAGKDQLALQLYPENYFEGAGNNTAEFFTVQHIPGVLTTVIVDWPDMVVALHEINGEWRKHEKEVFTGLLDKLKMATPYAVNHIDINRQDSNIVALIEGPEVTAATHGLVLQELYPQLVGEEGALVSFPNRHMILVKRLDKKPSKELLEEMRNVTEYMFSQNEYRVSPELFRYKDGKYSPTGSSGT